MRRVLPAGALAPAAMIALAGLRERFAGPRRGRSPAEAALRERLAARDLAVRWVRCADSGVRSAGDAVFRCTVDYGDPHIQAYCAVLRGGALATQARSRRSAARGCGAGRGRGRGRKPLTALGPP